MKKPGHDSMRRMLLGGIILHSALVVTASADQLKTLAPTSSDSDALGTSGLARFNHLGIPVDDLRAAIEWYTDVFDYKLIAGPIPLVMDDSFFGKMSRDFNGPNFPGGEFAHMLGPQGVGLELFYIRSNSQSTNLYHNGHDPNFWRFGPSHFGMTVEDVPETVRRITEAKGKKRSNIWKLKPDAQSTVVYCEDPFGNIIELYDIDYRTMWAS